MIRVSQPQLLSSIKGEITSILLVYPGIATEAGDLEYSDIVAAFDGKGYVYRFRQEVPNFSLKVSNHRERGEEDRKFRQIHNLRPAMDVAAVLKSWRAEMKSVKEEEIITFRRWAQDPFLVLACGDWAILLNSLHNQRMCDFFLPLEIAQQAGPDFLVRPTRLYLEGGNVLRGERCVFLGKDLIMDNVRKLGLSEEEVLDELHQALGCANLFPVGLEDETFCLRADGGEKDETFQPLFHLDMFLTPGGLSSETGTETVFLADSKLCVDLLNASDDREVSPSEPEESAHGRFDEVRDQLSSADFHVVRLPVFFCDNTTFTWNNCLVEVFPTVKRVYLPSYQCEHDPEKLNPSFSCLETKVEEIFSCNGFEVTWFRMGRFFRTLARHGGSLHCIVKVMSRRAH